jgi:hypothetical protein
LKAVNRANRAAFYGTYFTDSDGDLAISSRMSLTESMSEGDLAIFLQEENDEFMELMKESGLLNLLV